MGALAYMIQQARFWDFHSAYATLPQHSLQMTPTWSMQEQSKNFCHLQHWCPWFQTQHWQLRQLWEPFGHSHSATFFSTVWWARHLSDHANPCNIEFYILTDMVNSLKQVDKIIDICFQYLIWRWNTIQSHYLVPLKSWAVAATTISVCKGSC